MATRDLVLHNFWWKLLSLLLATVTWLMIKTALKRDETQAPVVTLNTKTFSNVPITLMTSPYNTNQFRVNPPTATVEVSGKKDDLERLQTDKVISFVDLTKIEDEREVRKDVQVQIPKDCKVSSVTPRSVSVERLTTAR